MSVTTYYERIPENVFLETTQLWTSRPLVSAVYYALKYFWKRNEDRSFHLPFAIDIGRSPYPVQEEELWLGQFGEFEQTVIWPQVTACSLQNKSTLPESQHKLSIYT
ncbi:Uncharacterized protein Rs2_05837 [Raphanus sativus]|nr:Uncharacterized protein Rs2_05837 [Raphanus sativus]